MTDFQTILATIDRYQTIIIHRHQKPDPDAIGSQVGLAEIIRHNYPEKRVLTAGYNEPTLTYLAQMDTVTDSDYNGSLVIVTDTANTDRIDDDRYQRGDFLLKIDHHPNDEPYGDLYHVDTAASSASEIIANLAFESGLELPTTAVRLLFAGIIGDTGRFLFPSTTAKTFATVSKLRSYDFDFAGLMREMDTIPERIARFNGYILQNLTIDSSGAAMIVLTSQILADHDISPAEVALIVGSPGKIDRVKSWAIITQQPEGHYRVNLRSKTIVINELAIQYDGGGHPLASGAKAYSDRDIQSLWAELCQLVKEH
ncbi:MAG: bifunctional oligoribonuclease/PAP phosphatase NrnA [bacterium]|nr:bifunctional oligoribonuclease/PAP phosphatase NrnA [bacterium]